jgi:hypothetical protein
MAGRRPAAYGAYTNSTLHMREFTFGALCAFQADTDSTRFRPTPIQRIERNSDDPCDWQAGFMGSDFVLDWLVRSDEPVINLDKLTYAGNGKPRVWRRPAPHLHSRRHPRPTARRAAARSASPAHRDHFAAESHVDRSIHGAANSFGRISLALFACWSPYAAFGSGCTIRRRLHGRGVRFARFSRPRVQPEHGLRAELSVRVQSAVEVVAANLHAAR